MGKITNIHVIGAGQMGVGIAQVCAQSGYEVVLHDQNETALQNGVASIEKLLNRAVEKGRMTEEEKIATIVRIKTETDLKAASNADLVIEAIVENVSVKQALFRDLIKIVREDTILASNTSSISITELAAVTNHPERFIGMHFMNPVPVMKLVEVIRAIQTDDVTYEAVMEVAEVLNKTAVTVNDFPGFVANRILMPMINEAIYTVYEGVATIEDVDTVMKLGMNHPMGPLTLADFIGLDTCLSIMEVLHAGFGDSKYRPCPLLRQYVNAGWYGKKSGRGFYHY